jgi:signal transduction histidine kinase
VPGAYGRGVRMLRRWQTAPSWAIDAVLGTVILLAGVFSTAQAEADPGVVYSDRDALAWVLILAATLPYFVRRRAPVAVFVVTSVAAAVLMLQGYDAGVLPLALLVGCYTVAAYRPARDVIACSLLMAVLLALLLIADTPDFGATEMVSSGAAFGVALLLGWTMQSRDQRAAADERLRIAQELHDVVAHSLGVIAVQAGVGMHVIDADPAEAKRSLEAISRTSRSSLAEIRGLLDLVRNAEGTPSYRPAPGLADLRRLVEEVGDAGLPVELRVDGDLDEVPPGVGLAAYRIVQEALTNALRHAGAHRAEVRLENAEGQLHIEVTDDGRGPNDARAGGHGLVGMQERVAVYGGSVESGPGPGGGFRVAAGLPFDGGTGG